MKTLALPVDHANRLVRARLALDGLSIGDALGETCFHPDHFDAFLDDMNATAPGPWPWTDDTAMAHALFEVLHDHGTIDQSSLAQVFTRMWKAEPWRGYGAGAFRLLGQIAAGADWRAAAEILFRGGSFGNGSAMRIAPLAGYFAEDEFAKIAEQAALSAEVTHAHPEGIAGAIAVAVAGAYAWKNRGQRHDPAVKHELFDVVLAFTPPSEVREGIARATLIACDFAADPEIRLLAHGNRMAPFDVSLTPIVRQLGNGSRITCQDTVPYCVWIAAHFLDDYRLAIRNTIRASGDIDTNAAIVGGIVALAVGPEGIPAEWREQREVLRHS